MTTEKLEKILASRLDSLKAAHTLKGKERVVSGFSPAAAGRGIRWSLRSEGAREFLSMNSNSYLGLSLDSEVIEAGEDGARRFGAGPGAVRFISGTCLPHVKLEKKLAAFHEREACLIFSSAYSAVMAILPALITADTVVLSDSLNHNCIINAVKLARPTGKVLYRHLSTSALEDGLREYEGRARRALVVTDGIFSMRGDHAPLDVITDICGKFDSRYEEGVITVTDDSHGVGAFGRTGRGTEEHTGARSDILAGTLGKALGVNGGYAVSSSTVIEYLRETAPFYVYSNPVTPGEAAAALKALEILDSRKGLLLLEELRKLTFRLDSGIRELGYRTIPGEHPIVPLLVGDTERASILAKYLFDRAILATALTYPVVPKGEEEIRFQVSAAHTEEDIDYVLQVLGDFKNGSRS